MRLTRFTDYALRVLIYLGLDPDNRVPISQISSAYGISRNHLMKVVSTLSQLGYVDSQRGPGGGICLARAPEEINLSRVVLDTERGAPLVECFSADDQCALTPACELKRLLGNALQAFHSSLARHTLADLIESRDALAELSGIPLKASHT